MGRSLQHAKEVQKHIAWDADMAEVVRSKLTNDVLEHLRLGILHKYVIDEEDYLQRTSGQKVQEVACVLKAGAYAPGLPQTFKQDKTPLYTLSGMLGQKCASLDDLMMSKDSSKSAADVAWLVVLKDQRAVKLQMALMKLQSYMEPQQSICT